MAVTDEMIAQLRRMIAESGSETYSDDTLEAVIEKYPMIDADGHFTDDDDWSETYDMNAAAADIWAEKAGAAAANYDFSADGASFNRSQEMDMATRMCAFYRSRRSMRTVRMIQSPKETAED